MDWLACLLPETDCTIGTLLQMCYQPGEKVKQDCQCLLLILKHWRLVFSHVWSNIIGRQNTCKYAIFILNQYKVESWLMFFRLLEMYQYICNWKWRESLTGPLCQCCNMDTYNTVWCFGLSETHSGNSKSCSLGTVPQQNSHFCACKTCMEEIQMKNISWRWWDKPKESIEQSSNKNGCSSHHFFICNTQWSCFSTVPSILSEQIFYSSLLISDRQ